MSKAMPLEWVTGSPILRVPPDKRDDWWSVKDPSIVRVDDAWHLFATVRARTRSHAIAHYTFRDFAEAVSSRPTVICAHAGYWCAPQVFFFRPHLTWYLISQAKSQDWNPEYRAGFSTTRTIEDPHSWTTPVPMTFEWEAGRPYLDFWVICDDSHAFLFFTCDNGQMWRSRTRIADFPEGWGRPELAYEGDIFEASHIYTMPDGSYLCLIESREEDDKREFRALTAASLDSVWSSPKDRSWRYASAGNVRQVDRHWTDSVSHGELIRLSNDERLEADPSADFVFQGVLHADRLGKPYGEIPWELGVLRGLA